MSVVFGAVVSTVQVKLAGVGSRFPAVSIARTWKVWLPTASPARLSGVVHAANAAPSRLHSKLPASVEVKVKVALVELLTAGGVEVSVVFGAVRSTIVEVTLVSRIFCVMPTVYESDAVFAYVPSGAVTVTVTLPLAPLASVPSGQVTVPAVFTPPPVAETKVVPAGSTSTRLAEKAAPGPAFA